MTHEEMLQKCKDAGHNMALISSIKDQYIKQLEDDLNSAYKNVYDLNGVLEYIPTDMYFDALRHYEQEQNKEN